MPEIEEEVRELDGPNEINADAIVEAFSDDSAVDEDEEIDFAGDDEDGDFLDTNTEIMKDDRQW